ncbi:MAG: sigma-54 dependent transcriptional regulator, partial [Pedobacter sp.]|nr:sigma-54 dependent transcriptional regulator [Pedobacter sp.]
MENTWIRTLSDFFKLTSAICVEIVQSEEIFQFIFFNKESQRYNASHTANLTQYRQSLKLLVTKIIYGKDPVIVPQAELKTKLLPDQSESKDDSFKGIIGNSPLLKTVFNNIRLVAPDDTSVLILGDSGTGKERIASAIHKLSPRKDKPFITVNCAALPLSLLESELFGHEKGAFTGANDKRIGKFEQADGGSIFLDEIGEMPLEAQVKLLRVLQEKEIERLGGTVTKKINVRIIAATNRNLEKEVSEGRLRLDLYYRLNVFPIELPPLRERKEDIPALVTHFLDKYNKNAYKTISGISVRAMETLVAYDWPGNIRELEHLIERSILMSATPEIQEINLPANTAGPHAVSDAPLRMKTMEEMERDHILSILKMCKGKIFGPGGAAEVLKLPSTTLNSKIKKLGIKFEFV